MIGYLLPDSATAVLFLACLLTGAGQMLIALQSADLLRDRRALHWFGLFYGTLSGLSTVLALDLMLAIASAEGGIYLDIPDWPRLALVLPALLLLYARFVPVSLPSGLRPLVLSGLVPLLRLPLLDGLPPPLPAAGAVFAAAWLAADTVRMLLACRAFTRTEITRTAMPLILGGIDYGICIADRRGWIIEENPAFTRLCARIGAAQAERIDVFEASIAALAAAGRLTVTELADGRSIHSDDSDFLLLGSRFCIGRKSYACLALSDVTEITRTTVALEQENTRLAGKNQALADLIAETEREEAVRVRERLCRAVHDLWSQRLAVAGLSVDRLLDQPLFHPDHNSLTEIARILDLSEMETRAHTGVDLADVLRGYAALYRKLGVVIETEGQATFSGHEQTVLADVLKEALANAVRHAYARQILIRFTEQRDRVGVTIINPCLEETPGVQAGRGLRDLSERVRQANGSVWYEKKSRFELSVTFGRSPDEG